MSAHDIPYCEFTGTVPPSDQILHVTILIYLITLNELFKMNELVKDFCQCQTYDMLIA